MGEGKPMALRNVTVRRVTLRFIGALGLLGMMSSTATSSGAHAADGTSLYVQGAKNLTKLSTFVEHFSFVEVGSTFRFRNEIIKAFDRKNTRVEGQQTLIESRKGANGKWSTSKYVSAVEMLNNRTYVRTSRSTSGWAVHSGYGYTDPVTKGRWLLAAPDYSKSGLTFTITSRSKGMIHLAGHGMKQPETVSVDITSGPTPLLARITTSGRAANTGAGAGTFVEITSESQFNKKLNITAPKVGR
jgi:hypothetical protein